MSTIRLDGQEIDIIYHHKNTKHSYVRVKPPGVLHVTVGQHASAKLMNKYIQTNKATLLQRIAHHQQPIQYQLFGEDVAQVKEDRTSVFYDEQNKILYLPTTKTEEHLKQFEKQQLLTLINEMLNAFPHKEVISVDNLNINTRYTKTIHGSCNAKKRRINLNLFLVRKDKALIHYVLMHELAHLKVQHHGTAFYQVLDILCPNHKALRKKMRT